MSEDPYTNPSGECDLIMQGGITSGVVYPAAVLKLAARYRFRSIGGTSAGAIAAAITAAAELARSKGGFDRLTDVPDELAKRLASLFQPARPFRGAFALFLACLGNRSIALKAPRLVLLLVLHFWLSILVGLVPVLIYLYRTGNIAREPLEWAAIITAALFGVGFALVVRALGLILITLPRKSFGVCSGLRSPGSTTPALTEWIAGLLMKLAGLEGRRMPLTFGDLSAQGIELKMMTTDVSVRRPYSLPFQTGGDPVREGRHSFNVAEWRQYFPAEVLDWLLSDGTTVPVPGNDGFRFLPEADHLPVIVAVRMSLSFPFLLAAIPLYRHDYLYRDPAEREKLRRCVFSDGGISSNFPIHFFDTMLPMRPTFGISLEDFSPLRYASDQPNDRVYMPQAASKGFLLPIDSIDSVPGFIGAIIDSARQWQDNLQKILSGYRERTAHIALTEFEGGLNLNMEPDVITRLTELGKIAGDRMLAFDMEEHQWRRFLVAYARLEEMFQHMNGAYSGGFQKVLDTYPPNTVSYKPGVEWLNEARRRLEALMALTATWESVQLRTTGKIPKPDTDLRVTPRA